MKHFKKFDKFGENFSFNYNGYDKYSTRLGGIIFLIYIFISLFFFISNFIHFYYKKNFTLQFYTFNTNSIEEINLTNSFAFGLDCESETFKAYKYFNINIIKEIKYNTNSGNNNSNSDDSKNDDSNSSNSDDSESNNFENCTIFGLGEELKAKTSNLSIHGLNFTDFKCLNKVDNISGVYTDQEFSYYKITVEAKNNEDLDDINDFLDENECNLQFFYKDYRIDINKYKKSFEPTFNSLFLPLNPDFNMKKNVYFMNYILLNKVSLFNFHDYDEKKNESYCLFSKTEDYFIYEGNKTKENNDSKRYATIYLRADNRKTEIRREYQNLLDFYADSTSFWIGIFEVLNIFFTVYNGFHASLSMSKKLFFFDELKENNKYNILRKDSLKSNKTISKISHINTINNFVNANTLNELSININDINDNNNNNEQKNNDTKNASVIYQKNYNHFVAMDKPLSSEEQTNINKKSTIQLDENDNKNYISVFEVIKISIFTYCECCEKKIKLKYKEKIIKEAMNIFDKKLDIYIYTKNMILIDIMYQILMNDINKDYVNFLSRSLIYLNKTDKKESKELEEIYEPTTKLNSDYSKKLYDEFMDLMEKNKKTDIEKKIISLYKN